MQSVSISAIVKLLLVMFLSVKDAPQNAGLGPALETLAPAGAVGSAVLDVTQLRTMIRNDPELAKDLFDGRTPEAAYGEAIEAMSERTRVDPAALRDAIARVHAVGLWTLGMADHRRPRFVVVFDRGDAPDILPTLLSNRPVADGADASAPRTVVYAGRTLYVVGRDPREALWLAEINGMLVLASDALAAETFLLQAGASSNVPPAARIYVSGLVPPLFEVHADVGAVVNGLLPAMGDHDRAEFMAAGAFFDLPAWRGASLRVDWDTIVLRAEIDPGSPMAAALQPPQRLELIDAIPADSGLAAVVSFRDASKVWDLFEAGFSHMAILERGDGPREEFLREFHRGTGLDVQTDLVSNLVAVAVVVIDPADGLKLERRAALLLEGKDPECALAVVRALVAQAEKEGGVAADDRPGAKVWRTDDAVIALKGNVLLVAPSRGDGKAAAERMLKHFTEGGEGLRKTLAARQAGATTFATMDASRLFPRTGLERLTAGFTADAKSETVRIKGDGRNLAAGLLRLMFDVGTGAAKRGDQARAMNSLRQVAMACQMYAMDHAKLPAEIEDLKPYLSNLDAVRRDLPTGQTVRLNPAVAGRSLDSVKQTAETVLVYAPPGRGEQTVCAAFCDGSVRVLTPAQFETALKPAARAE